MFKSGKITISSLESDVTSLISLLKTDFDKRITECVSKVSIIQVKELKGLTSGNLED